MFITNDNDEQLFFGEESWHSFLKRDISTLHPFIKPYMNELVWLDFF